MQLDLYKNGTLIQSVPLANAAEYRIGRASDNDIVLESPSVSRTHAKIVLDHSGTITIFDLESTNGTFLVDKRITVCQWLNPQDFVMIGDVQLRLRSDVNVPEHDESRDDNIPVGKISPVNQEESSEQPAHAPLSSEAENEHKNPEGMIVRKKIFAGSILMTALIIPFVTLLVIDQAKRESFFLHLAQLESVKAEQLWNINKQQQLRRQLAKARKLLDSNKLQSSKTIIAEVLSRDPSNKEALALQAKWNQLFQDQKIKKDKLVHKKSQEQENGKVPKSDEKLIIGYLKTIQNDIAQKKYADCLIHAQKIIRINPENQRAVQLINFCNNALVEIAAAQKAEEEKKAQEEQIQSQLQNILKQGENALRHNKYRRALKIFQKGLKLDPEKRFEVTHAIEQQIQKAEKSLRKLAYGYVRRANNEDRKGHAVKALHYYELARNILPKDEKIKSLYRAQLKANQEAALNLYNEAIAYASLGSFDEAKTALKQAKKLAKGNRELSSRIKKKLKSLPKE